MAVPGFTGWLGTVLSCPDPVALGDFYARLLGWEISSSEPTWVTIRIAGTTTYLAFAAEEVYEPPVWPSERGRPQQQSHLDVGVRDVDAAVAEAQALGATLAAYQPQDDVRVLLDPAGHPFCLYRDSD